MAEEAAHPQDGPSFSQELLVHVGSRAVSKTLMAPFDRVKVLLQCESELIRQERLPTQGFGGMRNCIRHCTGSENPINLWRGNAVNCLGIIPTAIAQVGVGTPLQKTLFEGIPHESTTGLAIASVTAAVISAMTVATIVYPIDLIRFSLSCDVIYGRNRAMRYGGAVDFVKTTLASREGQRRGALYRGLCLSLSGNVLYRFSFLTLNNLMTLAIPVPRPTADEGDFVAYNRKLLLVNYFAVLAATIWAYPIDTVRRRIMLTVNSKHSYDHFLDCVMHINKTEGSIGFFRGLHFVVIRNLVAGTLAALTGIGFYSQ